VPRVPWNLVLRRGELAGDPDFTLTVHQLREKYVVSVEVSLDEGGSPFVTGVTVRSTVGRVSPREVQRLPLARFMLAATSAVAATDEKWRNLITGEVSPFFIEELGEGQGWTYAARDVLVPRGRPQRGKSTKFYRDIANSYRDFATAGESPVRAIARRKRAPENTVHQWIHRARELGFLEPSPRSKRKERD